ncbi:serine/threonine-protein kinase [Nocardiopsis tropica]|uniref:Serine/threonine-protein kinase n=1 Tax=Nocardiopsis tropica TaxID=109330 RepID=A0ABU7L089_9ACTN|nr:serine/threonine-protein kinase [Nocardiopsis umidischolae]MEE2054742.1 serine/threonine-protein kinase [Nocardiopsis umidischolae]
MADPLRDSDPAHIGPYTLHARLGGGGMGQVFLGRSPGGHTVAVKVVRPELADDADFRRRFATEVASARKVGGFYTAPVVDADTDATPPWLATAYIPGPTLHRAVTDHGPLPAQTVAVLGAGLAEGLAAVHAQGIVHRDLKPANVLLAQEGPRLIDFGIARALDTTSHTHSSTVLGTAAFMSPEQARAQKAGPASDVFSLGCVLAFAATGRSPFGDGPIHAVLYRVVHEDPDLADLLAPLAGLVQACLAKDSGSRPGVEEVMAVLAAAAPSRPGDGGWLPPDITEVLARHTLTLTRVETPQDRPSEREAAEPGKRPVASDPGTADADRAELVIGNLGLEPLEVLLDGASAGTVPGCGRRRFPLGAGKHTVQVVSAGRRGAVRRIEPQRNDILREAFDIGSGKNAAPELVEQAKFRRNNKAVTALALPLLPAAALMATGSSEIPVGDVLGPIGTLLFAVNVYVLWVFYKSVQQLVLRGSGLEFGNGTPERTRSILWSDLTQVSVFEEEDRTRLVVWPRKDLQLDPPLEDFQGGKHVCTGAQVGAQTPDDAERLRAALRWFADDRWVEQNVGQQGGR